MFGCSTSVLPFAEVVQPTQWNSNTTLKHECHPEAIINKVIRSLKWLRKNFNGLKPRKQWARLVTLTTARDHVDGCDYNRAITQNLVVLRKYSQIDAAPEEKRVVLPSITAHVGYERKSDHYTLTALVTLTTLKAYDYRCGTRWTVRFSFVSAADGPIPQTRRHILLALVSWCSLRPCLANKC